MERAYVRIDVSKDRLDVHVLPEGEPFVAARDGEGLGELVERMGTLAQSGSRSKRRAASRSSWLPRWRGLRCRSCWSIRRECATSPRRSTPREDRSDRRGHDRPVRRGDQAGLRELHDEATQLLVDLVARHRQIIEMIVAERNREKRFAAMRIPKSLARLIAALEKELSEIDAEIDASVRGSPAWRSPHVQGRRWMCLLELMCRRIGWTSASGQAAKPCRQA